MTRGGCLLRLPHAPVTCVAAVAPGGTAPGCRIDFTQPTTVRQIWQYLLNLRISGSNLSGELSEALGGLVTTGRPDARHNLKITRFRLNPAPLILRVGGVTQTLDLHFSKPTFSYNAPVATLTIPARAAESSTPRCPTGSTGTLTYSSTNQNGTITKLTATLALCHSLLGRTTQEVARGSYFLPCGVTHSEIPRN